MPLVSIRYAPAVTEQTLTSIVPTLCITVAELLTHTDDAKTFAVTPEMVKIRFSPASPLDVHMPDIYIEVEARAFKGRIPNVEYYAATLSQAVAPLLPPNIRASVWFKLCHAGWHGNASTLGTQN